MDKLNSDLSGQSLPPSEVELIKGTIHDAEYVKDQGAIVVVIKAEDGTPRPIKLHKSNYLFGGKSSDKANPDLVDREMEKTAAMLRKAKGCHYKSYISRT